jgi:hypothetical protein
MKTCTKCKKAKEESEFNLKGNNYLHTYCKICQNAYSAEHYKNNKEVYFLNIKNRRKGQRQKRRDWLDKLKDKPCADCGGEFHACIMDFDHVRGEKVASIASMMGDYYSLDKILVEIDKCDLVCSNCHRMRTHLRNQY